MRRLLRSTPIDACLPRRAGSGNWSSVCSLIKGGVDAIERGHEALQHAEVGLSARTIKRRLELVTFKAEASSDGCLTVFEAVLLGAGDLGQAFLGVSVVTVPGKLGTTCATAQIDKGNSAADSAWANSLGNVLH